MSTSTPEIYTLSLHDALPIFTSAVSCESPVEVAAIRRNESVLPPTPPPPALTVQVLPEADSLPAGDEEPTSWHVHPEGQLGSGRSEEHTSELQSRGHLVCRLL